MSNGSLEALWKTKSELATERELKREAVLRTAARAFSEAGYHQTSLDDVAHRLNISKPTLYRYVRSKDDILYECLLQGVRLLEDALQPLVAYKASGIEKMRAILRVHIYAATQDFGRCLIIVGEDPLPENTRERLRELKRGIDERMREAIAEGIQEGSIRRVDPKVAAFTLAGALNWVARWYDPAGELTPRALADQMIDLLLNGLKAEADRDMGPLADI